MNQINNSTANFFCYIVQNNQQQAIRYLEYALENDVKTCLNLQKPDTGDTSLHLAIRQNLTELAIKLLRLGADPYAVNREEKTPFEMVLEEEQHHVTGHMLARTQRMLDSQNGSLSPNIGRVILAATEKNNVRVIQKICEMLEQSFLYSTLESWTFHGGDTALHFAITAEQDTLAKVLLEHGADPSW